MRQKLLRVGTDLSPGDLAPGMRLVSEKKGVVYHIVKVMANGTIRAKFRRGKVGRFSTTLHEIVPSQVLGFTIVPAPGGG